MMSGGKVIVMAIGGLAATAAGYADMLPLSQLDAEWASGPTGCQADPSYGDSFRVFACCPGAGLNSLALELLPQAGMDTARPAESPHLHIMENEPGSVAFCLYALLGLGVVRSAPWMRRLSSGIIPDWYHLGGPVQVGHSHRITPDCLSHAEADCFVQPDHTVEGMFLRLYRRVMATSPWRRCCFACLPLAPRGPPDALCQ